MNDYHVSVLLKESIDFLNVRKGSRYIDATLGGGGHTEEILKKGGLVLGVDADQEALDYVVNELKVKSEKFKVGKDLILAKGNFKNIDQIAKANGFEEVEGIIYDLGVSSHQLDVAERGFSFQGNGPLDMRMDSDVAVKAQDLVNILTRGELQELLSKFGEERYARQIADNIVMKRREKLIRTTFELSEIVREVVPRQKYNINPATQTFQALRIVINDELNSLSESLPKSLELLRTGGRMSVISFHSLEDRIVKNLFKDWDKTGKARIITKKPVVPTDEEIYKNKRARSSKLRVVEKI